VDLLARVASFELLHDAVEKHFRPYVLRNQLSFDGLLVEYCHELMDGASKFILRHIRAITNESMYVQ
jgi:hypothetical protein